jgi:hypothetical protein
VARLSSGILNQWKETAWVAETSAETAENMGAYLSGLHVCHVAFYPACVWLQGFAAFDMTTGSRTNLDQQKGLLVPARWPFSFLDHVDRATGLISRSTTAATRSKARLDSPRCRRMNRVIEDAGRLACAAILLSGRPSMRMAARRLSDGAIRCTFIAILLQGGTLPHWQR